MAKGKKIIYKKPSYVFNDNASGRGNTVIECVTPPWPAAAPCPIKNEDDMPALTDEQFNVVATDSSYTALAVSEQYLIVPSGNAVYLYQ